MGGEFCRGILVVKREMDKKLAAALKYDPGTHRAPHLVAKGGGAIAERIIKLARKNDIPIKNDPALVQVLSKLDIDDVIPQELYQAVAEVLAFVYRMNEARRGAASSR